jgi:hypothetical protein
MQSATKAIEEELKQARKGVAYYSKRVEDLQEVLATLSRIDIPASTPRKGAGKKNVSEKNVAAKNTAGSASKAEGKGTRSAKLPSTGKDFWPSLLNDTPQSAAEVLKAAIAALRIRPTPDDRKKLSQRMSNALSVLAKNGDIVAEGAHRTRLYSRKPSNAA